jgi:hypothetical protein
LSFQKNAITLEKKKKKENGCTKQKGCSSNKRLNHSKSARTEKQKEYCFCVHCAFICNGNAFILSSI